MKIRFEIAEVTEHQLQQLLCLSLVLLLGHRHHNQGNSYTGQHLIVAGIQF